MSGKRISKVSIIIPVYNNLQLLKKCISSLRQHHAGAEYELVIVDDGSTEPGTKEYLSNFENVIQQSNQGFIKACNHGAKVAIGEYLLFMNSDIEVLHDGWLGRLVMVFEEKEDVGIVGCKLIFPDDTVQHCGMEFSSRHMNFIHRHYRAHKADPQVNQSGYVPAVTGALFMVRRKVWDELNGFDEQYVFGYFEDTDFCMRALEKGWKTYYCASVEMIHHQSATTGGCPSEVWFHNHEIFKQRWIRTGKLCRYPKIAACYIVFNEAEFISESLASIYPWVHKIIIVEGCTEYTKQFARPDGSSSDGTVEKIKNFNDPQKKIVLIQGKWKDKTQMRNEYCKHLKGFDYALVVDGDEVWSYREMAKVEELMFKEPHVRAFSFGMYEFWKDFTRVNKGVWEQFLGRRTLIKLDKGLKYKDHLTPVTEDGQVIPATLHPEIHFHHYNYCQSDEKIKQKFEYYLKKGTPGFKLNGNWYEEVWKAWDKDRVKVESTTGNHPFGGGYTVEYLGDHPEAVRNHPKYQHFLFIRKRSILFTCDLNFQLPFFHRLTPYDVNPLDPFAHDVKVFVLYDFLSHYSKNEIQSILNNLCALLDNQGEIRIIEPDAEKITRAFCSRHISISDLNNLLLGNPNHQFGQRKTLLNVSLLKIMLLAGGFSFIQSLDRPDFFLEIRAFKSPIYNIFRHLKGGI